MSDGDETWGDLILKALEKLGIKKFLSALLDRKHHIIVIGSTGAGKTALSKAVISIEQQFISVSNRTTKPTKKKIKIEGSKIVLMDTPGEMGNLSTRMSELSDLFSKNRVGVVIVGAFGYNEYREADRKTYSEAELLTFLEVHRKIEIDHLDRFASQFPFINRIDWAITVATKADLWWTKRKEVLDYYNSEEFKQVTKRICRHTVPVRAFSSTIEPFLGSIPADGSFGEAQRRQVRSEFIEALLEQVTG